MNLAVATALPIRSTFRIAGNILSKHSPSCHHHFSISPSLPYHTKGSNWQHQRRSVSTDVSTHSVSSQVNMTALVKQLRELTGAPMMECKKALSSPEAEFDLTKAIEWLRKHGSAKATSKVSGREALEGLVGIHVANRSKDSSEGKEGIASLVKVASETDFASRSQVFSSFVQEVADAAVSTSATNYSVNDGTFPTNSTEVIDIPSFLSVSKNSDGKYVRESLSDVILSIRENIHVDSIFILKPSSRRSVFAGYVHGRAPQSNCGTAAAVVELEIMTYDGGEDEMEKVMRTAKNMAMHVVAAKPLYLNPDSVPAEVVEKERKIAMEKMADTKKPPAILEKIIQGQLQKFYDSVCLTEQPHLVEEGNPKVSKLLKSMDLEVKNFQLISMSK